MPPATEITPPARELILECVALYNYAVWPIQLVGVALAAIALVAILVRPGPLMDAVAKVVLDLMWLWVGAMFFISHLGTAFKGAYVIGALLLLYATLLLVDAYRGKIAFRPYASRGRLALGLTLVAAGTVVHPLAAWALKRGWPFVSLVGSAPGPTAAFTCALLVFAADDAPAHFLLVPAAWALIAGLIAAAFWGYSEELIPAGVAAVAVAAVLAARRAPGTVAPAAAPA